MAKVEISLWEGVTIPPWNRADFYDLFCKVNKKESLSRGGAAATDAQRGKLSKYLMHLIAVKIRQKKWIDSFGKMGIDLEDVASELLYGSGSKLSRGLLQKMRDMKLNACEPAIPREEAELVLMRNMDTVLHRDTISIVRKYQTKATGVHETPTPEDADYQDSTAPMPALDRFADSLRESRETICAGTSSPIRMVRKAFACISRNLLAGKPVPPMSEIPESIRTTISVDDYTAVVYRIKKFVRRYAADLA